jgi:hypothetical protein
MTTYNPHRIKVKDLVRRKKDLYPNPLHNYGIVKEKMISGKDPAPCIEMVNPYARHSTHTKDILGECYVQTILRAGQTISWDDKGCGVVFDIIIEFADIKVKAFGEWGSLQEISIKEIVPFELEIQFGGDEILNIDWHWRGLEFRSADKLESLDYRHYTNSHPIHSDD